MAKTEKRDVKIKATPDVVYDYLVDLNNLTTWQRQVVEAQWEGDLKKPEKGARYVTKMKASHRPGTIKYTVLEARPGEIFSIEEVAGKKISVITYRLERIGRYTTLILTINRAAQGPLAKLVDIIIGKYRSRRLGKRAWLLASHLWAAIETRPAREQGYEKLAA